MLQNNIFPKKIMPNPQNCLAIELTSGNVYRDNLKDSKEWEESQKTNTEELWIRT